MIDDQNLGFSLGDTTGIDVSDEALDARGWEPEGVASLDESVVEPEADPTPSDDVEAPEESTEDAPEADEEETPEEQPEPDPEDVFELPEKLAGKSAEDLAKMYLELEKQRGGQTNELGELRTFVEQQTQQIELLRDHLARQAQSETADDLVEMVRQNPQGIYQQAVRALDQGQITIDVVEEVISEVRGIADELAEDGETGAARQYNDLARAMERDFDRRLTIAQAQATQAPLQAQAKQQAYEKGVAGFFNPAAEDYADAITYQQDVTNLLKGKDLGDTPEAVQATLKQALIYVRGQNPTRSAAFKAQQEKLKGAAQSERGSAEPAPKPLTEEEKIRQSVFNRKDPGAKIFESFAL